MADGLIQVPPDSTGKKVDASSLDVGLNTVMRQRIIIGDNSATAAFAVVAGGALTIAGTVNVSAMPTVTVTGGVAISGTATVAGVVGLTAGTAVIGDINAISRTVQVAIGTPFTLQGISTTVTVTVATPFTVNNISATVLAAVTGTVNISGTPSVVLAAGTANFGTLNGISATVVTGLSYVIEKTTNSQVQVGDSANAALRVNVVAGSAGGPSNLDNSTFSTGVTPVSPSGFIFFSASATAALDGRVGAARMTEFRAVHVNMRTAGGTAMEDATNNALRVNIVAGGGSGGTAQTDGTTFSTQAALFTPVGGIFDDTLPDTLSENDAGIVRMTTNRAFHVNLRDAAGAAIGDTSATGVFVRTATVVVAGAVGISGTAIVAGVVGLTAGTAVIGDINAISRTVQVAIGTPFTVNNISATVVVSGLVGLTAGTANIGFINNISASVLVATGATADFNTLASADQVQTLPIFGIALPASGGAVAGGTTTNPVIIGGTVNVSATASVILAAGAANIGIVNNISATVIVAGVVSLGAGTANIGFINNISATVQVAIGTPFIVQGISTTVTVTVATPFTLQGISTTVTTVVSGHTPALTSVSHGPTCKTASTSANVTLIATPGAGNSIYVTGIAASNAGAVGSRARIGTSASLATVVMFCASAGGGFVMTFDPPWKLSASEAALCSCKPNTADMLFNVNFYVAAT
jgi:filamentous hemagglutinin